MTRYISLDSIALVVSRIFFFRKIDIRTLSENTSPIISSNGGGDTAETSIAENQLAGQDNRRVMLRIFGACRAKRGMP
jgi:hypothetical protein